MLTELDVPFESVGADTQTGTTNDGTDYRAINPKGYVPALEIEPGIVLTENPAILQYLADLRPHAGLAPAAGTLDRIRLQEWLNFTSSELHKAFGPWFSGRAFEENEQSRAEINLARRIDDVERGLSDGRSFILGQTFTVADAYLFVVLNWTGFIGFDLARWSSVAAYVAHVVMRPAVRAALVAEGFRRDNIDAIDIATDNIALARVRCSIGTRDFVDFLTLVRVDGKWRIHRQDFQHHRTAAIREVVEMPYVNIKITDEGTTREQKAELIGGVTDLLVRILNKNPATTFVVIDEVAMEDWGVGGLPVADYRRQLIKPSRWLGALDPSATEKVVLRGQL